MSNTKKKAPISWHFTCQPTRIYETFKEQYFRNIKVQVNCVNNSGSDSYDKNDMQEKVNVLVRLHETMQEKLNAASYSEPIESRLTLVQTLNGLEYTIQNILLNLNTLFKLHMKSKK